MPSLSIFDVLTIEKNRLLNQEIIPHCLAKLVILEGKKLEILSNKEKLEIESKINQIDFCIEQFLEIARNEVQNTDNQNNQLNEEVIDYFLLTGG